MALKFLFKGRQESRRRFDIVQKAVLRSPPTMSVPDWADTYRVLSASVGAVGGRWQTHRVEVARGPMMAVTEPGVESITIMSCTQIMKTEVLLNVIGYMAQLDPSPILLLEPKDEMAQAFSKERFSPMVASSPALRGLFDTRTRNSEDTILNKRFPGGFIAMSSAGSATNLAMRAIRVTLLDEVDKYETTKEGDPITLAEERTSTYRDSAIKIRACSPTWEETSRIYRSWLESDQRRPFVRCPHCDHEQTLDFFKHVHWHKEEDGTHKPETAAIYCEACGAAWSEAEHVRIMASKHTIRHMQTKPFICGCMDDSGAVNEHGERLHHNEKQDPLSNRLWEWDETRQVGYALCVHCHQRGVSNRHAGFTASKLYSPFLTTIALVMKWLEAKDDPETKQTFYNTQLGQPFRAEVTKEASHHTLAARAENYTARVPKEVVVLTAGIDVQAGERNQGRLEVEVVGWAPGEESWSIDTKVLNGDPAQPFVWNELDAYLLSGFRHELGFDVGIMGACIDSGGHHTQEVYAFAKPRMGRNVWAIKGASDKSGQWSTVWPPSDREKQHKKFRVGFRPILLGVNAGKEAIRQRLLVEDVGPGYCHFPVGRPDAWYEQLTSERLTIERKAGVITRKWVKPSGRANEALDCRVYAYAALHGLYHTRKLNLAKAGARLAAYIPPNLPATMEPGSTPVPVAADRKVALSNFMQG